MLTHINEALNEVERAKAAAQHGEFLPRTIVHNPESICVFGAMAIRRASIDGLMFDVKMFSNSFECVYFGVRKDPKWNTDLVFQPPKAKLPETEEAAERSTAAPENKKLSPVELFNLAKERAALVPNPVRRDVEPFTREIAQREILPFTFNGAAAFFVKQIKAGRFIQLRRATALFNQSNVTVQSNASVAKPSQPLKPQPTKGITADSSNPQQKAQKTDKSPAAPIADVQTATGKVLDASTTNADASNYTTFCMVLQTGNGEQLEFTGADLRDKFAKGVFAIGDFIHLEKRVEHFSVQKGGKVVQRYKNVYVVHKLNSMEG